MYSFGAFQVDTQTGELRKNGVRIHLQAQPFQILLKLLEHPGKLVTREELRAALWPANTFVDFDTGLNTAVKRVRDALGDSAEIPRYIETVPKKGYRFIGAVESVSRDHPEEIASSGRTRGTSWMKWVGLVGVLAVIVTVWWTYLRRAERFAGTTINEVVPLTGMISIEDHPTFSPDGNQVAYTVFDPDEKRSGIYAVVMGGEKPLRLTTSSDDCCPVWSPDGRSIAFARGLATNFTIYLLPALGGTPRKIYEAEGEYSQHVDMSPDFSWSPDGKYFTLSLSDPRKQPAIALVSLADSSKRFLTSPPAEYSDWSPSFSPDGKLIAFLRSSGPGFVEDVYVVPVAGGEATRLTLDSRFVAGPVAWTPDSKEIIFASNRGGIMALWRLSASGGAPRRLEGVGLPANSPALSLKGHRLAYASGTYHSSLRHLRLRDTKHAEGEPKILVASKNELGVPHFSADGQKIVFESSRSGYPEIWTVNADGSSEAQLTYLGGFSGTPRWSHDGGFVAFDYRPDEHSEIYRIDAAGGTARLVPTNAGADNAVPSWSHDGKWIYFASNRGNEPTQVWKVPASGGAPVQLTKNGGVGPIESADGFVYYSKSLISDEILKMPIGGGEETQALKGNGLQCWCQWTLAPRGIYFFVSYLGEGRHLMFKDFATKKIFSVMKFQKTVINPAVAPDGKSLVYVQVDQSDSSIMLVNGYR